LDYVKFCSAAAKSHERINTVVVIASKGVAGAWARPGQFVPDPKTLEKLLLQVEILLSIAKSNVGLYGTVGYVMVTHKKADFFFVPARNDRILLVSIDRPYDHGSVEERMQGLLKELDDLSG
jgi:hypothetical protein